jgi:hypothetical protein
MTASAAWAMLARVLTFCIPVPVIAIAAVAGWLWIDRTSAVRQAVDRATAELVAGGEIAALKARVAAAERDKIATDYAYAGFSRRLAADEAKDGDRDVALPEGLSGRPWTVEQPDIDWVRQ